MAGVIVIVGIALVLNLRGGSGGSPERPFVGGDLHSLVVDPTDPSRIFVGGHDGVGVSSNSGKTWNPAQDLDGADAMGWAFDGRRVLVGGHPGLHVSTDGGATFKLDNDGLPATDIHALGAGESVLYAASPQVGVFASSDEGRTWEVRSTQVGQSFMGRILVDAEDPDHIVAPDMSAGAVESRDGGRTWAQLGGVPAMWVSWDPSDVTTIVVSGASQAALSTDGGKQWSPIDVPEGVSIVEMSPGHPHTLFGAAHEGSLARVWVSRDGGASWKAA